MTTSIDFNSEEDKRLFINATLHLLELVKGEFPILWWSSDEEIINRYLIRGQ